MLPTMTMTVAATVGPDPTPSTWWLTPLMALLGLIFGGGGVAAIMKARYDRAQGVAALEVTEDDAISARWQSIIEAQTESLVKPLRERLVEVEDKVKALEADLTAIRSRYWKAIAHIRVLMTWIRSHIGTSHDAPAPPAEIAEDI